VERLSERPLQPGAQPLKPVAHILKSGATIRVGADRVRSTRGVMDAELNPKELLNRILQLKEHL
jgi:hypothetical protein